MARIRKINVSQVEGNTDGVLPAGTIVAYEVNGEYVLRVHDGVTAGGVPFPNAPSIIHNNDINITVNSEDSSSYTWNFGQTGALTLPRGYIKNNTDDGFLTIEGPLFADMVSAGEGYNTISNGVEIITHKISDDTERKFRFSWDGSLYMPTGDNSQVGAIEWRVDSDVVAQVKSSPGGGNPSIPKGLQFLTYGGDTATTISSGFTNKWIFRSDGTLTIPGDIRSEGNINIDINLTDSTLRRWSFGEDGGLSFPDATVQTTAWTGILPNPTYSGSDEIGGATPAPLNLNNSAASTLLTQLNLINTGGGGGAGSAIDFWTYTSINDVPEVRLQAVDDGNYSADFAIKIKANDGNGSLTTTWTFGANGKLTVPGDIVGYQAYVSETPADERVTIQPSGSVDKPFLFTTDQTDGTWERSSMELPSAEINKAVTLGFPHNNITTGYIYNQGTDTQSGTEFNNAFNVMANSTDVKISTVSGGGNKVWKFAQDGDITLPASGDVLDSTGVSQTAQRVEGSWTVTTGTNTYSFTVPMDGTYTMWVKGNIPNGIITWNATLSVTNSNVPAIGTQYTWNYTGGGSPILLTSIPDQIRGAAGTISTDATYAGTTSNRFDFGISNTSGASQTIYYGYTKV